MALVKAIKDAWVEALRSGEYVQTEGFLKNEQGYCCLGVLREVVNPNDESSQKSEGQLLSVSQLAICGLDRRAQSKLADMNDAGQDFDTIADYIESRLRSVDTGTFTAAKKGKLPARDSQGRFIKRKKR